MRKLEQKIGTHRNANADQPLRRQFFRYGADVGDVFCKRIWTLQSIRIACSARVDRNNLKIVTQLFYDWLED